MVEGDIFRISKFSAKPNYGFERATNHDLRIWFNDNTIVVKVINADINQYSVKFKAFSDIMHGDLYYTHCIGNVTTIR